MPVPLSINLFARGANGVPDYSGIATRLDPRARAYEHTISDRFGFESMRVPMGCDLDEAIDYLQNGLMRPVVVHSPDAMPIWEGFLKTITARVGQKRVSLSLDTVATRVRCKYNTSSGTPGTTASSSNTAAIAIYGTKDRLVPLSNTSAAAAAARAASVLGEVALPRSREATESMSGEVGPIELTLTFAGWYDTLGWVLFSNTSNTSTATNTQVGTLIGTSGIGIGVTNPFLQAATWDIVATGVSDTEFAAPETTYRQKIEQLLGLGNSSNQRLTWGVYEGRVMRVAVWAASTPTTITYEEDAAQGVIYDAYGSIIPPWLVRPNAIARVRQLIPVGPVSGAVDAIDRKYVGRVTCSVSASGVGCTLEPSDTSSVDALLATFGR